MEGIRVLRAINGMTQAELSSKLMIAQNTLSNWENGNREPDADALTRIANLFGVSVDMLLQIHYQDGRCPECGLNYNPGLLQDVKEHSAQHAQWQEAVKRFGFCWPYAIRENVKRIGYAGMHDENLSCDERTEFCICVFKAWFSRSLDEADYCSSHTSFPSYVAMRLNQEETLKLLPQDVGTEMIRRFGKMKGIPQGSYYTIKANEKRTTKVKAKDEYFTVSIVDPKGEVFSKQVSPAQAQAIRILLD
jgi:transcriptional regulator with XRE-family HTH domain